MPGKRRGCQPSLNEITERSTRPALISSPHKQHTGNAHSRSKHSMNDSLAFLYARVHYWGFPHPNLRWVWLEGEEGDPKLGGSGLFKNGIGLLKT